MSDLSNRLEDKIDKLSGELNHHMLAETKLQTGLLYTLIGHTVVGVAFIGVFTWHYLNNMAVDFDQRQDISKLETRIKVIETKINKLESREPLFP